jgi:hypothetical protein
VLLDGNAESLGHKFKLLVKFFGLHTLFDTQLLWEWLPAAITSQQDAAPTK